MQISWLFLSNLGLSGYPFISVAESHTSCNGSDRWQEFGLFTDSVLNRSGQIRVPGCLALQGAVASVAQVTGGFLFLLKQRTFGPAVTSTKSGCSQDSNYRNCLSHNGLRKTCTKSDIVNGNISKLQANPVCKADTLSVILGKIMSIMGGNLQNEYELSPSYSAVALATALVPSFDDSSSKLLPIPVEDTNKEIKKERHESLRSFCEVQGHEEWDKLYLSLRKDGCVSDVTEPRTGIRFPTALISHDCGRSNRSPISQVLVGIGSRCKTVAKVKSLKIYAFGLYVHPNSVCKKLGERYSNLPLEELKNHPDLFEDLLRHDLQMTVRLVVHYKGLKLSMVRNAFEGSLRRRLRKIKGVADDDGMIAFCSYFSKDISLSPGTTIDFHRLSGGKLRTEVGGEELGTIYSHDLCRAFFDLYVGEEPVSLKAKQDIGENIGRVLQRC